MQLALLALRISTMPTKKTMFTAAAENMVLYV